MSPTQATIGDALIFMTKAALACVVLVIGAWLLIVTSDNREAELRGKIADHLDDLATQETIIRELGDKLNTCLLAGGMSDERPQLRN